MKDNTLFLVIVITIAIVLTYAIWCQHDYAKYRIDALTSTDKEIELHFTQRIL